MAGQQTPPPGPILMEVATAWPIIPEPPPDFGFSMVALLPVVCRDSYGNVQDNNGFTAFQILSTQEEILANPALRVYPSLEVAKRSLEKSHPTPGGTTRVFDALDLFRALRARDSYRIFPPNTFPPKPTSNWYRRAEGYLLVTDLPIITDPKILHPSTLAKYKGLPALGSSVQNLLSRDERYLRVKSPGSTTYALPVFGARRTRKDGKLAKSPKSSIKETKRRYLSLHLADLADLPFFTGFRDNLYKLFTVLTSTIYPVPVFGYSFGCSSYYFYSTEKRDTWASEIRYAGEYAVWLAQEIEKVLTWDRESCTTSMHFGPLRSPVVWLNRRRRGEVLSLLSPFKPHLPRMKHYPNTCDSRLSALDLKLLAQQFLSLHSALYRLARAVGCRSFPGPLDCPSSLENKEDPNE